MMTGRWLSSFTKGTASIARVLRVASSKVRMPRSQRMTFGLPFARMYSAARSHSSMVEFMPRLSMIGFWILPTSFRRA